MIWSKLTDRELLIQNPLNLEPSLVLKNEDARNVFLPARGKLAKSSIWVGEDLPATYRRRKSMLRDLVKVAKQKKYQARIDHGGISIDGKTYGPEQFPRLLEGIRPHDAATRSTVNNGLAFSSKWTPLSNMAPAYFPHDGTLFNSAEQCYQYSKALFENEDDLANEILMLTDAYDCKRLAGDLGTSDKWILKRDEVMATIIKEKFTQNDDMRDILLNTGNSNLFEATTDQYWGIGSSLFSKTAHQETGKGENKLGLMLTALRVELGGEPPMDTTQTPAPDIDGQPIAGDSAQAAASYADGTTNTSPDT